MVTDEKDSAGRHRDWEWGLPVETREGFAGGVELGGADEEGEAALGVKEARGERKSAIEALDGAEGDQAGARGGEVFGAGGEDVGIIDDKGADDFAKERCFFLVRFDQGGFERGSPELDGEAGEAGAGAEVQVAGRGWRVAGEQVPGGEEGFAEMSCHDTFFVADGGEIHA